MEKVMARTCLMTLLAIRGVFGGGTESFDKQVRPILKTDEPLAEALFNGFDLDSNVWAQVRLGSHTKFGGQRLGPYSVLAKPKGSQSPWVFEITINTRWTVYDGEGNEIPLMDENGKTTGIFDPKASHIDESFIGFEVKRYGESPEPSPPANKPVLLRGIRIGEDYLKMESKPMADPVAKSGTTFLLKRFSKG